MYTILICDDDKDIVRALEIYLANPDYKIIKAYNGEEALQRVVSRGSTFNPHGYHDACDGRTYCYDKNRERSPMCQ